MRTLCPAWIPVPNLELTSHPYHFDMEPERLLSSVPTNGGEGLKQRAGKPRNLKR